jgi:hypothetical protein
MGKVILALVITMYVGPSIKFYLRFYEVGAKSELQKGNDIRVLVCPMEFSVEKFRCTSVKSVMATDARQCLTY